MNPHDAWRTWDWQPATVAALSLAAFVYGVGVRRLWLRGRARGVRPWHVVSFLSGLAALFVALVSPLHALSQALLVAHMAQHVLLIAVAPPLIVLGMPAIPFGAALPPAWRRAARALGRPRPIRALRALLSHPVVAWALPLVALWVWHAPSLYDVALRDPGLHVLEHASFFATALLYWWVAMHPGGHRRLAQGHDVLYVFTGSFQGAALGFLLTFATVPLYPFYQATVGRWGLTALHDQQLAGIVMWLPSGLIYLVMAGALFLRWLRATERSSRRREGTAGLSPSTPFPPSSTPEASVR